MPPVLSLTDQLHHALAAAIAQVVDLPLDKIDPVLRPSEHAHFQANAALGLAKRVGRPPRQVAQEIVTALGALPTPLIESVEIAGPGFINIHVPSSALVTQLAHRLNDPERLGIGLHANSPITVIDYSQPNIAKEMHVGHLRSTVIGDSLVRVLEFLGVTTIRQNHIGDWGTAFGMLIEYMFQNPGFLDQAIDGDQAMSNLNRLYKASRAKFDAEPAFADLARLRVVALQAGDEQTVAAWHQIVEESLRYFTHVYDLLDVRLTGDDVIGESFYNPWLAEVVEDLLSRGVAVIDDGAVCIFYDDIKGQDGEPTPLIIRKKDGGYGYGTTDLAAIRYRVQTLGAKRVIYVVDTRQSLHFKMVFDAARRAGYLTDDVEVVHVNFGTVLGEDNKPLKSRAGDVLRLSQLLEESVERAHVTLQERDEQLDKSTLDTRAREIGIGAVKYADLSNNRIKDYVLDFDRMLALQGNTSVYLQYANARINSVIAKSPYQRDVTTKSIDLHASLEPEEIRLLLALDAFEYTVNQVADELEPHRLATYLFDVAQLFTSFYEACPILKADTAEMMALRLSIADLTRLTLARGLDLLGIRAPERL